MAAAAVEGSPGEPRFPDPATPPYGAGAAPGREAGAGNPFTPVQALQPQETSFSAGGGGGGGGGAAFNRGSSLSSEMLGGPKREVCMEVCGIVVGECCDRAIGRNGFVKTSQHLTLIAIALAAFVIFCWALSMHRMYDAVVAGVLFLMCLHTFHLLNERFYLQVGTEREGKFKGKGFDLKGYAREMGIPIQNLFLAENGAVLNRLLSMALAKDNLRCLSAIQRYRAAFGPLSQTDLAIAQGFPSAAPPSTSRPCAAGSSRQPAPSPAPLGLAPLPFQGAAGAGAGSRAYTPRSPQGPPSPGSQRQVKKEEAKPTASSPQKSETKPAATTPKVAENAGPRLPKPAVSGTTDRQLSRSTATESVGTSPVAASTTPAARGGSTPATAAPAQAPAAAPSPAAASSKAAAAPPATTPRTPAASVADKSPVSTTPAAAPSTTPKSTTGAQAKAMLPTPGGPPTPSAAGGQAGGRTPVSAVGKAAPPSPSSAAGGQAGGRTPVSTAGKGAASPASAAGAQAGGRTPVSTAGAGQATPVSAAGDKDGKKSKAPSDGGTSPATPFGRLFGGRS